MYMYYMYMHVCTYMYMYMYTNMYMYMHSAAVPGPPSFRARMTYDPAEKRGSKVICEFIARKDGWPETGANKTYCRAKE